MEPHIYDQEYKIDLITSEVDVLLGEALGSQEIDGKAYSKIRSQISNAVMEDAISYGYEIAADVAYASMMNPDDTAEFIDSVEIFNEGETIYVRLGLDASWKIRAMEYGCPPFDMKPGLLANAFVAKYGDRMGKKYRRIPMKETSYKGFQGNAPTASSSDYQTKVRNAIKGSKYKWKKMDEKINEDGSYTVWDELKVRSGLEKQKRTKEVGREMRMETSSTIARMRTFRNKPSPGSKVGADMETVTTFKTVSEDSTGWFHPGFPGMFLLATITNELNNRIRDLIGMATEALIFGESE